MNNDWEIKSQSAYFRRIGKFAIFNVQSWKPLSTFTTIPEGFRPVENVYFTILGSADNKPTIARVSFTHVGSIEIINAIDDTEVNYIVGCAVYQVA